MPHDTTRASSTLWTVVRIQWLILRRDRLVWFVLAVFVGLLTYAGVSGALQHRAQHSQQRAALDDEAARLRHLTEVLTRNPPPPAKAITTMAWSGPEAQPTMANPARSRPEETKGTPQPMPLNADRHNSEREAPTSEDALDERAAIRFNVQRYDRDRWRAIQQALGMAAEQVDGRPGPLTAQAIYRFQRLHPDLIADGKAGSSTLARLTGTVQAEPSKPTQENPTQPPDDDVPPGEDAPEPATDRRTPSETDGDAEAGQPPPSALKQPEGPPESEPYRVGNTLGVRVAALPPGPLASMTLSGGERPTMYMVTLESQLKTPEIQSRPISLGRMSLGVLDMAFVLIYVLPLLTIALSYDLILGEREQQTLALVLSQPISPATFITGKMLTRAAWVGAAVLGPSWVFWLMASPLDGRGLMAVVLATVAVVSYMAFWWAAAMATNAWMRTSAASALALMGLWLACLVLVPGVIQLGVEALYPPPSRVELVNLTRKAAQDAENTLTVMEGNHGQTPTGGGEVQVFLNRKVRAHQHMEQALDGVLDRFDQQLRRQQTMVRWLQVLSPSVVLREGLAELAGDSVERHQYFKAQAKHYHDGWQSFFYDRITRSEPITAADIKALEGFVYAPEDLDHIAGRVVVGLGLGIWVPTLALLIAALIRIRRIGRL
ncbi:MAG: DUF3526 domain-containing protein [Myxococcota bacterium]